MEEKQVSMTTQSEKKMNESVNSPKKEKNLLNLGADVYVKTKPSPPKFPAPTETVEACTFEVNMEIQVRIGKQTVKPPKEMITTLEQVIDTNNQVFRSGVVTILSNGPSSDGRPVERMQGVDAIDVRAILRLLGIAE